VQDGALSIAIMGKAHAHVGLKVEVTEALLCGHEEVPLTITATLEDFLTAGRDMEGEARGQDELIGLVIN
jgi:hypothetical protein